MFISALKIAGTTLFCACIFWSVSALAKPEESMRSRLARGEIIQKSGSSEQSVNAVATAVVNAPPEHVWAVISDCSRYAETMYRVKTSKLLEKRGSHWICEITVALPGPFADLLSVTDAVHTVEKNRWERKWTLLRGDYKENHGSWLLAPFGDDGARTLVVYRAVVKPTVPVPQALIRWAQKKTVAAVFEKLREEVAKYRARLPAK